MYLLRQAGTVHAYKDKSGILTRTHEHLLDSICVAAFHSFLTDVSADLAHLTIGEWREYEISD